MIGQWTIYPNQTTPTSVAFAIRQFFKFGLCPCPTCLQVQHVSCFFFYSCDGSTHSNPKELCKMDVSFGCSFLFVHITSNSNQILVEIEPWAPSLLPFVDGQAKSRSYWLYDQAWHVNYYQGIVQLSTLVHVTLWIWVYVNVI